MLEPEINNLPAAAPHFDPEMWQSDATEPGAPGELRSDAIDSPLPNFNQCFHQITAGHRCNAPALRGEYFCRHHFKRAPLIAPPHSRFEMPEITGRESARAFAIDIASRVAANSLDVQRARTLLSSLRVVLSTFPPQPRHTRPKAKEDKPLSPDDARKTELWARLFLAREEAKRTGAPDPFDAPFDTPAEHTAPTNTEIEPSPQSLAPSPSLIMEPQC